jgi:anti-sigma factor RsiW
MNDRYQGNHARAEEQVHAFLDGELGVHLQSEVFAHLASCARCRATVNDVLRFRQLSRQEYLPVPPAVDEEFYRRLEQHKVQNERWDRAADRRPLWHRSRVISLRTAVVAAGVLLGIGFLAPSVPKQAQSFIVRGETEQVEFRDVIYVIYPGLTVEAAKL